MAKSLFVGTHRDARLIQIDPSTNKVVWKQSIPPQGISGGSLLAYDGALWIAYHNTVAGLARMNPVTHQQVSVAGLRDPKHPLANVEPYGLVALNGSLWIGDTGDNQIRRVDPKTARLAGRITVRGVAATNLAAAADGSLWLQEKDDAHSGLYRVDPTTGRVTASVIPFPTSAPIQTVAVVGTSLWAAVTVGSVLPGRPTVVRIDTDTNRVTARLAPKVAGNSDAFPSLKAGGDGTLWLQTRPDRLTQIDPTTGAAIKTLAVPLAGNHPLGDYWASETTAGFGSTWVTSWPGQGGPTDPEVGSLYRLASK